MTACFDIYVMPSGCSTIWTYPSRVHPPTPPIPGGTSGGGGRGRTFWEQMERKEVRVHRDTEEDELFVLGLFDPSEL